MKKIGIFVILIAGFQSSAWSQEGPKNEVIELSTGAVEAIGGRQLIPGWCEKAGDTAPDGSHCSGPGARYVQSTIALVKGVGVDVVVDPGFLKVKEGGGSTLLRQDLATKLKAEGVGTGGRKTFVFISHHHPDHTINAALVPDAESPPTGESPTPTVVDFWATYQDDFWEDHADNYVIAPDIEVMRTPGHTHQDASLIVRDTVDGTVVFTHVWWFAGTDGNGNVQRDETGNLILFPPVDPIGEDQKALEASRRKVICIADVIIPGHGSRFKNPFDDRDKFCDDGP